MSFTHLRQLALLSIAVVFLAASPVNAAFQLEIRVSVFDSGGSQIGSSFDITGGGPSLATGNVSLGGFNIVIANTTSTTGGGQTGAGNTVSITSGSSAISETVVIEYLASPLSDPLNPAPSQVSINGSTSSTDLSATSVTEISGVFAGPANTILALAGAATALTTAPGGLQGTAIASGVMTTGAATTLTPNPALGAIFVIPSSFGFYQKIVAKGVSAGVGGIVENTSVNGISQTTPFPEPASMAIWGLGAAGMAFAGYRRRKLNA